MFMKLFLFLIFLTFSTAQEQVCTDGFDLVNNKCWQWFPGAVNYNDAVRKCSSIGANLFTAKNAIDNRAMLSFLSSQNADHLWMGLYCFGIDRSHCYWNDDDKNATTYGNFAGGFPNVGFGKCVYYSHSGSPAGLWANGDCFQQLPFVCELPPTTPDNCTYNYQNHCYFPMQGGNMTEAITACNQLCATVVSVHSQGENRFIASLTTEPTLLGAVFSDSGYVWIDGTPTDYNNDDGSSLDYIRDSFLSMWPGRGDFFVGLPSRNKQFICKRPTGVVCNPLPSVHAQYPQFNSSSNCFNPDMLMTPAVVATPGYPNYYPSNIYCTWNVHTTGGHRIQVTFVYFHTQANHDMVRVFDGDTDQAPMLGIWSGQRDKFTVVSNGPSVLITFNSGFFGYQGFTTTVTAVF